MTAGLTEEQIDRYARQIVLRDVGGKGQKRLLAGRALCVGAGGLGCPAAIYLAAAGVGTLGVIDDERVELSNLQRQILHATRDVGQAKTASVRAAVEANNPDVRVRTWDERLAASNVEEIFADFDVVLDGSDNFATRYLVADTCARLRIPLVTGSVYRFEGQVTTIVPGAGNPCYRCLFPRAPEADLMPSCSEAGVLGAVVGTIGSVQAAEVLKLLLGIEGVLKGKLLTYNALAGEWRTLTYGKANDCPLCGNQGETEETQGGRNDER